MLDSLHDIGKIRNYFVHVAGFEIFPYREKDEGKKDIEVTKSYISVDGVTPDPKDPTKQLDFNKMHQEFMSLEQYLSQEIGNVYNALGGMFIKNQQ